MALSKFFRAVLVIWIGASCAEADGNVRGLSGSDASVPPAATNGRLRVLTYNVAGLPEGVSSSMPEVNIPQISPLLNGFDLITVQEDFWYWDALRGGLETTFFRSEPFSLERNILNLGDGLNFFSRFPFDAFERIAWARCSGRTDCRSDCLATKGFTFARVRITPQFELDVYDVHLDAGRCDADFQARAEQLEQLAAFVQQRSPGRARLIAGDFNIKQDVPNDRQAFEGFLQATSTRDACLATSCTDQGVDRVLVAGSTGIRLDVLDWRRPMHFVDSGGNALSDHEPVAVDLAWTLVAN